MAGENSIAPPPHAKLPNILFLLADDMRADSLGALGDSCARTPNLDSLVRRGFHFTNAYCLGGNSPAVCLPSRNMILSGNTFFRWQDLANNKGKQRGMFAPPDGPNIARVLANAGYSTYHHGKRGNTAVAIQATFQINKYLRDDQKERMSGEPGKEIVDDAIAYLRQRDTQRPFFMYLALANPHDPRVAAPQYLKLFDPKQIPLPKNFLPLHPFDNGEMTVRDEALAPWPRPTEVIRQQLHQYHAVNAGMDHHLGRLLRTLDELRLTEETLIIFSADQGISLGSHGLLGKQNLYDPAMKAPLVFAGPNVPMGQSAALVYLLDIFPTICDLVGIKPPPMDGRSFGSVLQGTATSARAELMLAYRDVQRAYRDERWKLIRYPRVDVTQLFDLHADPNERQNLAEEPDQQNRVTDLMTKLEKLQPTFGDNLPLRVKNVKPKTFVPPSKP